MVFNTLESVNRDAVLAALGYGQDSPDAATAANLEQACKEIEHAARPRWTYTKFSIDENLELGGTGVKLTGQDIAAHLEHCASCFIMGLTLGPAVERATLMAEAQDMALAVLMDAAASILVETYADMAEAVLRNDILQQGEYMTARFSPGYGDFPISLQPGIVGLLDGPRAIGLTVSASGIMIPRKSITAVLGISSRPVKGKLAGCANCALRERCMARGKGKRLCEVF